MKQKDRRDEAAVSEKCRLCHKECFTGIWLSPQFKDEKVLLFCSVLCKDKYVSMKLERIRINYPKFSDKVKNRGAFWIK